MLQENIHSQTVDVFVASKAEICCLVCLKTGYNSLVSFFFPKGKNTWLNEVDEFFMNLIISITKLESVKNYKCLRSRSARIFLNYFLILCSEHPYALQRQLEYVFRWE